MYLTYSTEHQDADDKCVSRDFESLEAARRHARQVSRRDDVLVYVVATNAVGDRVGAECYAGGRKDHADGRVAA